MIDYGYKFVSNTKRKCDVVRDDYPDSCHDFMSNNWILKKYCP